MTILKDLETPIFAAEGVPPEAHQGEWKLRVDGLVQREALLDLDQVRALGQVTLSSRITSVSGFSVRADWNGLPWRTFIDAFPPTEGAAHVVFRSVAGYDANLTLEQLDHPRVMLAWGVGGEPLEPEYGGPLRMVIPHVWGYKSCKWLARITFTDRLTPGYWESRGYSVTGEIEPGITLDVNTGSKRRIKGGEVTEF
jgi:DMSO/TMAO reductase YedYZ molybdopterin-dependent catalytic subunit